MTSTQSDDWRGEHLLRGIRRDPSEGNGNNFRGRRCAHIGCKAKINRKNTSKVCDAHKHGEACECLSCVRSKV